MILAAYIYSIYLDRPNFIIIYNYINDICPLFLLFQFQHVLLFETWRKEHNLSLIYNFQVKVCRCDWQCVNSLKVVPNNTVLCIEHCMYVYRPTSAFHVPIYYITNVLNTPQNIRAQSKDQSNIRDQAWLVARMMLTLLTIRQETECRN